MLDFLVFYGGFGVIVTLVINALLYGVYRPVLSIVENIACILLWPTVIVEFINEVNKY
jgi:hypothetical protein